MRQAANISGMITDMIGVRIWKVGFQGRRLLWGITRWSDGRHRQLEEGEGQTTIARYMSLHPPQSRPAKPNLFLTFTISRCKRRKNLAEYLV